MAVIWTEPARADLERIFQFNLMRTFEWAERVDSRLRERGEMLARLPSMGRPMRKTGLRALSITDIQYRLDGRQVTVLRVRSTREIQEET